MNLVIDDKISLIKKTHKYILKDQPEIEFKSVTTFLEDYFEPFDEEKIAFNLCASHKRYVGMDPVDLIAEWHAARDHGSKVHDEIELFLKKGFEPSESKTRTALEWLKKYCMKSDIEIIPEVIIYSIDLRIAGTVDILAYDKKEDVYEIIDWKTSKKIEMLSYGGKMGIHPVTADLMDCKHNHYAMQLSFYRYLLEEYYGIKVRNQMIAHLQNEVCTIYITPYYNEHISAITAALN
ncbi:MAG: hypothetical protein QGI00_12610 [Candidatus Marinimicrobia bacterium]|nr:hypothetical protein [Candidatus Neomarinimicrobiota bacterium]